jgi:redox-sensing transcriptional repressor
LGRAILASETLRRSGLDVVGIFDSDGREIGTTAEKLEVMPLGFLPDVMRVHHVELGIVAVGAASAQSVVDTMVKNRIGAIWSFAPTVVFVPEGVILHNGDLCSSFAPLSARLAERRKAAVAMATALQPDNREV